jgi:hypothetical protein
MARQTITAKRMTTLRKEEKHDDGHRTRQRRKEERRQKMMDTAVAMAADTEHPKKSPQPLAICTTLPLSNWMEITVR